ncbi:MAG TPA: recombinase family protein [Candidatus Onthomonas avicola]|nr:recombinase family protein [Candidatus Onthomonas avicola]
MLPGLMPFSEPGILFCRANGHSVRQLIDFRRRTMLAENELRIHSLLGNDELAEQVLQIVREDEAERRAVLVRRQSEGLKNARERGVRLGRPPAKRPRKFGNVYAMFCEEKISARAAAQMLNVSPGTFKRWVSEEQGKKETNEE